MPSRREDNLSRPRISIREMEIDDLAPVYHLGESLFTRTALPALYRTWDPYEVTSAFTTDPEFCLVAEDGRGNIVGFALGSTVEKEGSSWRYGYLAWLGVKEEFQGLGVAQRLLHEFEKRMKEEGVRMLIVDTEGDNAKALAFFRKNGFRRPTSHVWLTKSLVRPENGVPKPLKPLAFARRRTGATPARKNSAPLDSPIPLP
ncbi:Acetyltransferase YpeA [bacterium HR23]|nr:Acetyltransferase YpeA [bacterium HR23]